MHGYLSSLIDRYLRLYCRKVPSLIIKLNPSDPTASTYVHILHARLVKMKWTIRKMILSRAERAASVSVSPKSIHSAGGVGGLKSGTRRTGARQGVRRSIASSEKALKNLPQFEHDHLVRHTPQLWQILEICAHSMPMHQVSLQQLP